jgi:hypothetical protein
MVMPVMGSSEGAAVSTGAGAEAGAEADDVDAAGVAAVSLDELHAPRLSAAANATTAIETVFTTELLVY